MSWESVKTAESCLLPVEVKWRHSATHTIKTCLFCDGCAPFWTVKYFKENVFWLNCT